MMTWADFKLKFSKYHVPPGLIKKMGDEFRELKQGRMTVVEYRDKFLTLSRYAPDETNTTDKRKERFLNGLHDAMTQYPEVSPQLKRRIRPQKQQATNPDVTPRFSAPEWRKPRPGGHHNNNHSNSNYVRHNNNFNRAPMRAPANNNNTNTTPRTGSNAVLVTPKDKATITCYECGDHPNLLCRTKFFFAEFIGFSCWRSNVDPNNVPLASLVAQEENVDVNFIKSNNFNNNAYRNNYGNNYRPYPSANGNGYGNSYGNSYNNN
ncbi:hypothetical protein QYE76_063801 [Lolium multiflorum]|uniref:Retrotransposon gag domain-containing protein n=1 Tax=Lolium multiflorum TaxID=4521 RepID=A0AAD8S5B1_LOLMU|nr:hypothetical protein QYE76_063801 [Lolium multiflorum]